MRIPCPICGLRDSGEFTYCGDATITRPADEETNAEVWISYVHDRENPMGLHREYWQHGLGCRSVLIVERDTVTHEVKSAVQAKDGAP